MSIASLFSLGNFIEASSAASGAAFSTCALYPIDYVKTLLQASQHGDPDAQDALAVIRNTLRKHGVAGFFRGLPSRTLEQMLRSMVYFYNYSALRRFLIGKPDMSALTNLSIGFAAGAGSVFLTTPVEIASTRLQTGTSTGTLLTVLREMYAEEGLDALYR